MTPCNTRVTMADESKHAQAVGTGACSITLMQQNAKVTLRLSPCLYVPSLADNLLSVTQLQRAGITTTFSPDATTITSGRVTVRADTTSRPGEASINYEPPVTNTPHARVARTPASRVRLWHRRLGHVGIHQLPGLTAHLLPDLRVRTSDIAAVSSSWHCSACAIGKARRSPFAASTSPIAPHPLHTIHADIIDGLPTDDDGNRFCLTVVDEATRFTWALPLKRKGDAPSALIDLLRQEWRRLGPGSPCTSVLRTDGGTEFLGPLVSFRHAHGIRHETTVADSSASNGIAERANGVLQERMRALLLDAHVGMDFWADAIQAAAFYKNRALSRGI